jgi:hypothetical protein
LLNKVHHFLLLNKLFFPWPQVFVAAAAKASLRRRSKINHFLPDGTRNLRKKKPKLDDTQAAEKNYFCEGLS